MLHSQKKRTDKKIRKERRERGEREREG